MRISPSHRTPDFQALFESAPGLYLVLMPDEWKTMRKEIRRGWWDAALATKLEKLFTKAAPFSSGKSKHTQPHQEAGLGGVS